MSQSMRPRAEKADILAYSCDGIFLIRKTDGLTDRPKSDACLRRTVGLSVGGGEEWEKRKEEGEGERGEVGGGRGWVGEGNDEGAE